MVEFILPKKGGYMTHPFTLNQPKKRLQLFEQRYFPCRINI